MFYDDWLSCVRIVTSLSFVETFRHVTSLGTGSFYLLMAEAIRRTVIPITPLICTMVVPISGVIGKTVVPKASATGIGCRHDGRMGLTNKLMHESE